MHCNIYAIFYSQFSQQHVSAAIAAIFRVILLQEYEYANVDSCVDVTLWQLKLVLTLVKIT